MGYSYLVSWLSSRHPHWYEASCKLIRSADWKITQSWEGCTRVANVNEFKCLNDGMQHAISILMASKSFTNTELDIDSMFSAILVLICFVHWSTVGVQAEVFAMYSLIDLEGKMDDEDLEVEE